MSNLQQPYLQEVSLSKDPLKNERKEEVEHVSSSYFHPVSVKKIKKNPQPCQNKNLGDTKFSNF